jgi:phosphohistidine phosphatase SixA
MVMMDGRCCCSGTSSDIRAQRSLSARGSISSMTAISPPHSPDPTSYQRLISSNLTRAEATFEGFRRSRGPDSAPRSRSAVTPHGGLRRASFCPRSWPAWREVSSQVPTLEPWPLIGQPLARIDSPMALTCNPGRGIGHQRSTVDAADGDVVQLLEVGHLPVASSAARPWRRLSEVSR